MNTKEKELVTHYVDAVRDLEAIEAKAKVARSIMEHAKSAIQEYMVENDILQTADYPGYGRVSCKTATGDVAFKYRGWVLKENEHLLHQWLKENGRDDMIKPTIHHSTLNSFVQQSLENGENLPDFIKTAQELKIRLYKAKGV